ncbi:MAG TPA: FAD-binding protein [Gemmatimonadaceae bacterium]
MTAAPPPSTTAVTGVYAAGELQELVREASARGEALRIAGRGGWLDAGRPVRATRVLSVAAMTGIVDYVPGDLTLTARAGTSLDEIARATAAERQWLALDPFGAGDATLGATIATASAGPLAHAFGTPRDNVLGIEAVTGDARLIHAGGRVVKNVAGFDLVRLLTGAWGTLGVITEATVRLRALPETEESWALPAPGDGAALDALLARLRAAPLAPLALELVSGALARRLGVGQRATFLVRLGGNADAVAGQRAAWAALGDAASADADVWRALRACEPSRAIVTRLSCAPSRVAGLWTLALAVCDSTSDAIAHASPGRGIVRCILPAGDPAALDRLLAAAARVGATVIHERLSAERWASVPSALAHRLSRAARAAFDPRRILNPGILGPDT